MFSLLVVKKRNFQQNTVGTMLKLRSVYFRSKGKIKDIKIDTSGLMKTQKPVSEIPSHKEKESPLVTDLRSSIEIRGPLTMHDYISQSLNNFQHGYYQNQQEKIGKKGDFVTAPEVSQLFGEMIGVWCLSMWEQLGSPNKLNLVELGPGTGTMMRDIMRVIDRFPKFKSAVNVHFVELSQTLRRSQFQLLTEQSTLTNTTADDNDEDDVIVVKDSEIHESNSGIPLQWHSFLKQIDMDSPVLIIGQEFLDAFPIHQFSFTKWGWREKLVDVDYEGESPFHFRIVLSPTATPAVKTLLPRHEQPALIGGTSPKEGDELEISPLALATCEDIAACVVQAGGAALLVDYGEDFTQGDSLRAFKGHSQVSPLSEPGVVDLTADVDFSQVKLAGLRKGAKVSELVTQSDFLQRLGIVERVTKLIEPDEVSDEDASSLVQSLEYLILPEHMGTRFKVISFVDPHVSSATGFLKLFQPKGGINNKIKLN